MNFPLEKYSAHVNNRFRSHCRFLFTSQRKPLFTSPESLFTSSGTFIHIERNTHSVRQTPESVSVAALSNTSQELIHNPVRMALSEFRFYICSSRKADLATIDPHPPASWHARRVGSAVALVDILTDLHVYGRITRCASLCAPIAKKLKGNDRDARVGPDADKSE
jgi:hypothetical protein